MNSTATTSQMKSRLHVWYLECPEALKALLEQTPTYNSSVMALGIGITDMKTNIILNWFLLDYREIISIFLTN